jgi:hypothetical protein
LGRHPGLFEDGQDGFGGANDLFKSQAVIETFLQMPDGIILRRDSMQRAIQISSSSGLTGW